MRHRLFPILFNQTAAAPAFVPTDVTGLKLWLDFSDLTTLYQDAARTTPVTADGQEILGVADKSGVGNHHSGAAGTAPLYKAAIQNSKSIALFDGVDNLLSGSITAIPNTNAIFIVYQFIAAGGSGEKFVFLLNLGTGDANRTVLRASGSSRQINFTASKNIALSSSFVIDTYTGAGTGLNFEYFRNGASQGTAAQSAGSSATMNYLGSERGVGAYANVRIAEYLVYNAAITPTQRGQVETYLNSKWAVY